MSGSVEAGDAAIPGDKPGGLVSKVEEELATTRTSPPLPAPVPAADSSVKDTRPVRPDPGPTKIVDSRGAGPPRRFGRYEILSEIARGGMGVVYRARQTEVNRTVALKVLLHGGFASEDDERRFAHEAELAARLSHPNIVAVHDFGREGGRLFFTMELVEGEPLDRWAKDRPLKERLRAVVKACRAVHHAHMRGVIHRDLKPGNVLVTAAGEPKVLDFGLAKGTSAGAATMSTATGATIGTPFYMAPEQADGRVKDIDIRTDVYALGVVLYQLVSGEVPFRGTTLIEVAHRILSEEPRSLHVPADLSVLIRKAMEKDKALRYPTAEALADDLERFLAGEPVSARAPGFGRVLKRWTLRHPAAATGMLAVTVTLAAVSGWWWSRDGEIAFEVDAPGAWVELDGARISGSAPLRVRPGEHILVAGANGREPDRHEMVVGRGERRTFAFHLPISTGRLTLETDEPGTFVTILGENHGTPLTNLALPVGRHRAVIRRSTEWSKLLDVDIRRNETTRWWASVPESGSWAVRFPDGGQTACHLRDVNGDGVPDVSSFQYNCLLTFDGRNGARIFQTSMMEGQVIPVQTWVDVDGDGIEDDIVSFSYIPTPVGMPKFRVAAYSGNVAAAELKPGTKVRSQRVIWSQDLPMNVLEGVFPALLASPAGVWVAAADSVRLLQLASGKTLKSIPFASASLLAPTDDGGVIAIRNGEIARLTSGRMVKWRADIERDLAVIPTPRPSPGWVPCDPILFSSATSISARSLADGHELWSAPVRGPRRCFDIPAWMGSPRFAAAWSDDGIRAWDALKGGKPVFVPRPWTAAVADSAVAGPGCLFMNVENDLVRLDISSGREAWRRDLGSPPSGPPVCHAGRSGGTRVAVATADLRLRVFDGDGTEVSEFSLLFPAGRVQPCDADGYNEPDYVITGYGFTLARGTRVLWRRSFGNSVRPRPVVIPLGDRTGLALAVRGKNGNRELRCLDARTGDSIWTAGSGFDCIFEPLVHDGDGDGVPDIGLTCWNDARDTVFRLHSGRDGHTIFTCPTRGQISYGRASWLPDAPDGKPSIALFPMDLGAAVTRPDAHDLEWTSPCDLMMTGAGLADLDGDGHPEILYAWGNAARTNGSIAATGQDGKNLWTAVLGESARSEPVAIDLDGDGKLEVLVAGDTDLHVFDHTGRRIGRRAGLGGSRYPATPCEIPGVEGRFLLLGTRSGVALTTLAGETRWTYPSAGILGALGIARLHLDQLCVAGADREGRFFLLDLATGKERFQFVAGDLCEGGVTLADVDGDGAPEAFLGCHDGWLTAVDLR